MNKIKEFFRDNIRNVIALIVYFVGFLIILSINFESFNLTQKIILTSIAAVIFVLINKLFKRSKVK